MQHAENETHLDACMHEYPYTAFVFLHFIFYTRLPFLFRHFSFALSLHFGPRTDAVLSMLEWNPCNIHTMKGREKRLNLAKG